MNAKLEELAKLEEVKRTLVTKLKEVEALIHGMTTEPEPKTQLTSEALISWAETEARLERERRRDNSGGGVVKTPNSAALVLGGLLYRIYFAAYSDQDKGDLLAEVMEFVNKGVNKPICSMTVDELVDEIFEQADSGYMFQTLEELLEEFQP